MILPIDTDRLHVFSGHVEQQPDPVRMWAGGYMERVRAEPLYDVTLEFRGVLNGPEAERLQKALQAAGLTLRFGGTR